MTFATLCLAALVGLVMVFATLCQLSLSNRSWAPLLELVSPVAVQAQGNERWPEVSSTIDIADIAEYPSGCKRTPLRLASLRRPLTPSLATSLLAQTRSTCTKSIVNTLSSAPSGV